MVTQDTNLQLMYYAQAHSGLPWLCFTALEAGSTFAMVRNNGTAVPAALEISRDGGKSWSTWDKTQVILERKGDRAWLRGNSNLGNSNSVWSYFVMTGRIAASGSVVSLVYGDDAYREILGPQYAFEYLFYACDVLETPPELPSLKASASATTLPIHCYRYMFAYCTNLKRAPKLPAMGLTTGCYTNMFRGCTALKTPPELPATTLGVSCYESMFNGCAYLQTAPALPATAMAASCYAGMFSDCSALEEPPVLQSTLLANTCYNNMFYNCISLKYVPALPATVLAFQCYRQMFINCISIEEPPALPAPVLAAECYLNMFYGCLSLKRAPYLPATILAPSCYDGMFQYSAIEESPDLPFIASANSSCSSMFQGCRKLKVFPKMSLVTASGVSLYMMFYECISATSEDTYLIPLVRTPDISGSSNYLRAVFYGCRRLRAVEIAIRTFNDIAPYTYLCYQMFYNCANLSEITVHFKEWPTRGTNVFGAWVSGVAQYGVFRCPRELPIEYGANRIPAGWTVEQFDEPDPEPPTPEPLPELPAGYRVVEYLENVANSSGRFLQYIDTGWKKPANDNDDMVFVVKTSSGTLLTTRYLMSNGTGLSANNSSTVTLRHSPTMDNVYAALGGVDYFGYSPLQLANYVYEFELRVSGDIATVQASADNGVIWKARQRISPVLDRSKFTYSFRMFRDHRSDTDGPKQVRIHRAIIREGETVVRDLVPCVRESDGKPGFYDLCDSISATTNTPFYVNADTTAGAPDFNWRELS